jgi:citrate lyase subunit beta/citryl-CoA lyase
LNLRSLLFVPADSEKKLAKGLGTGADALILDLEDAVAVERLPVARDMARAFLAAHRDRTKQQLWVRVNPLGGPHALADLAGIVAGAPDGIVLPKVDSAADVVRLDHYLTALEAREGVAGGSIRILPVATETPASMFALDSYRGASPRLLGLTWGAEDLPAAMGATSNRDDSGEYDATCQLARTLCLLGAHAAGVQAIDTVTTDFRNRALLEKEVRSARRAGFTGKIAIHPDQIEPINAGFSPDPAEIAHAEAVLAAFERAGGAGTVQLDGKMLDKPHHTQALKVLAMAGRRPAG